MRRSDRARDLAFSLDLIDRCTHGVVAISTDEGAPYCLPLSLVRVDHSLYFHCAKVGRKLDLMRKHPQVCVTFCAEGTPTYEENTGDYTTYFSSVIATGTAVEVTEDEEKILGLRALCQRMTPEAMVGDNFQKAIESSLRVTAVWRIDLDEIVGKEKAPRHHG